METEFPRDPFDHGCPSREILARIADKWTTLVISKLSRTQAMRFSVLRREIDGISQKMLTQTLRDLERDGLVLRKVYGTVPPRVEYSLTPLGATLRNPLHALTQWSIEHIDDVRQARKRYDAHAATDQAIVS